MIRDTPTRLRYRSLPLQSRECGFRMCSDGPHWPQASLAPRSIDLAIPTYFYWKIPILVVLNLVVFVCCSIVCLLFIVNVFSDGPHCPPALSLATRPGPLIIWSLGSNFARDPSEQRARGTSVRLIWGSPIRHHPRLSADHSDL